METRIYFLIHVVLTLLFFVAWVATSQYSGGEIGMTPYVIMIISPFQFIVMSIIHYLVNRIKNFGVGLYLLISYLVFELIFLSITGQLSIVRAMSSGFQGELHLAYSMSSIFGAVATLTIGKLKRDLKIK